MTVVADASALVAALVDSGPEGKWAESALADASNTRCCFMTPPPIEGNMTPTRGNRKVIDEILEIRSRLRFERREAELFVRLGEIEHAYKRIDPEITELLRHFPVALVACMESYFRLVIKELVDSGEPYLSSSSDLLRGDRFDFDTLKGLHGQTITIGDVISRYPAISNLGHIMKLMDSLLGCDFREKLRDVYSRWEVEVMGSPKQSIIRNGISS